MTDKSAIVLGGSAGVGHAVVVALLNRGYRVGVVARGQTRLDTMQAEYGERIATAAADVSQADVLEAAVEKLVVSLGRPAIWVNCAMLTSFSPFDKVDADEFDRIVGTTLIGQVNGTRLALRHMDRGNIVNIGSGLGYRSIPMQAAYCAAKHGVNGFTQAVRSELIRNGRPITISLVQLPAVNTPQFDWALNRLPHMPQPAPPIFQPEVPARGVLKAIDTNAREILVGLPTLKLLFGNFMLPNWLDHMLARQGADMQMTDRPDPGDRPDNLRAPAEHPAASHGRFDDRAKPDGLIVDGDVARKAVFFGVPLLAFLLGLLLG
ncbi:short-chain dehydrogenase/reductase SDR [Oceaniovalibus guishaninsula JLT2003]|uniref:Short-chain dehydrogenase/reductase SDR n=1 Tax=Oceaniovalibus guishaninsula JLT2003 TaxID=1231392 RepID=K2GNP9_9RHOB|nr:SDR family oxidoreductase [Oceaniovalibus guishaninsula]EKE44286.1 short-chain dehydrogenase/reductase SDR [Oceaniovalibus guishaninsula JLT2003]